MTVSHGVEILAAAVMPAALDVVVTCREAADFVVPTAALIVIDDGKAVRPKLPVPPDPATLTVTGMVRVPLPTLGVRVTLP